MSNDSPTSRISAKLLLHSTAHDVSVSSWAVRVPKWLLAELNTYRTWSRSAGSSRAIPVQKILDQVRHSPFIPIFWGKNQPGMQARTALEQAGRVASQQIWRSSRHAALIAAEALAAIGLHKQTANRLLEPWMTVPAIITVLDNHILNMFAQRALDNDAQPEFQRVARLMAMQWLESTSVAREEHIPYVEPAEYEELLTYTQQPAPEHLLWLADAEPMRWPIFAASAARCARVSTLNHEGVRDVARDFRLAGDLARDKHLSPFEHQLRVKLDVADYGNMATPWQQIRKLMPYEATAGRTAAEIVAALREAVPAWKADMISSVRELINDSFESRKK